MLKLSTVSSHLPSPSPSPPPSILFLQEEPLYTRRCLGCAQLLIWCRWMICDDDFGQWYTFVSFLHLPFSHPRPTLLTLHSATWAKTDVTGSDGFMTNMTKLPIPSNNLPHALSVQPQAPTYPFSRDLIIATHSLYTLHPDLLSKVTQEAKITYYAGSHTLPWSLIIPPNDVQLPHILQRRYR